MLSLHILLPLTIHHLPKTTDKFPKFEVSTSHPVPSIPPSSLLVKLSHTGICGSDYHLACGHLGPTLPILGHEGIGRIACLGSSLSSSSFPIGAKVGVAWIRGVCNECPTCLAGRETHCGEQKQSGVHVEGTFGEYAVVPSDYVVRLPEGGEVGDELLAPIMCGGVTSYKALKNSGAKAGDWVVISGAGGAVGAFGVSFGKVMGFRIIAIDMGKDKGEYCRRLGAEAYIDITETADATEVVKSLTGGYGAAAVIITTPAISAYQSALGMLARLGTMVCVGIPPPDKTFSVAPIQFINRGVRIVGSAVGSRGDVLEAVEFIRRGVVKPEVEVVGLADVEAVCAKFAEGKVGVFRRVSHLAARKKH